MHRIDVRDATDPRLEDYRDLTDVALRRRIEPAGGLYIAESAKVIGRALGAGHLPRSVLVQEKWIDDLAPLLAQHPDVPVYVVEADLAERLTGYAVHRGALAAMHRPEMPPLRDVLREARLVVVLEDIVDHTNVGAIFRACAGLGADAVLAALCRSALPAERQGQHGNRLPSAVDATARLGPDAQHPARGGFPDRGARAASGRGFAR